MQNPSRLELNFYFVGNDLCYRAFVPPVQYVCVCSHVVPTDGAETEIILSDIVVMECLIDPRNMKLFSYIFFPSLPFPLYFLSLGIHNKDGILSDSVVVTLK